MKDSLLFCLFVAIMFFMATQNAELNVREEELRSREAKFVYYLVRTNRELDFTIKRFQQLQKINKSLKDYCIKYGYRGWVTYDSQFYFPCRMLNPKNKIRSFTSLELVGDMDTAGASSN